MKKIAFLTILIISFFMTGCALKQKELTPFEKLEQQQEIKIGVKADSKPFGYLENGEFKGFDIDIANYIFSKFFDYEPKKIKFVAVTPENKIMKLNSGEVDFIIAAMSITSSRLEVVDFSKPYYMAGGAIAVHKNSKIKSIQDLNDKKVSVILGTTGEKTLRQFAPNSIVKGAKTYNDALGQIKNKEVEAIYGDDSILYGLLLNEKDYKILNKRYTKEYYAIALRKEKNNEEIKTRINDILTNMQENGELNKIKKTWIPNGTPSN